MNRINPPTDTPTPPVTRTIPVAFADEPVVTFNCFEPNSLQLQLTTEDLVRHTLFVGTTGSGKTTTMNRLLHDLIQHRAGSPSDKLGLLVVDSKRDETVAKVRAWAAAAGRAEDVVVLEPGSPHGYDPLAELESLRDLESVCAKLRATARPMHPSDGFWLDAVERMVDAALTVMVLTTPGGRPRWEACMEFFNQFLLNPRSLNDSACDRLRRFEQLVPRLQGRLPESERINLQNVLANVSGWRNTGFDSRTQSSISACLANVLRPLRSAAAQDYFAVDGRTAFDLNRVLTEGKILVVSVDAAGCPAVAQTLIKLVKADFFRLLQARRTGTGSQARLVGIVLDEYPLAVTGGEGRYQDATQLQTLRSKRGFLVASTQGFISLDLVVGERTREALLANFNNLLLFRSHERQVEEFALPLFGRTPRNPRTNEQAGGDGTERMGNLMTPPRGPEAEPAEWVCGAGALNSLQPGQAFVSLACSGNIKHSVWFEPLYFEAPEPDLAPAAGTHPIRELIDRELAELSAVEELNESPRQREEREALEDEIARVEELLSQPPGAEPSAAAVPRNPDGSAVTCPVSINTHVSIMLTEAEQLELFGELGLLGRLCRQDAEFGGKVRVDTVPPVPTSTESKQVHLPKPQLGKLITLPPQTDSDRLLLKLLRDEGHLSQAASAGDDVPF